MKRKKNFNRKNWGSSGVKSRVFLGKGIGEQRKDSGHPGWFQGSRTPSKCGKVVGNGAGRAGWVPIAEDLEFIHLFKK